MASFKDNGRGEGSKKRPSDPRRRRQGRPDLEALENRRMLSGTGGINTAPTWHPTSTNPFDVQNGPLANLGADLIQVYKDYTNYEATGAKGAFTTSESSKLYINGLTVGVDARGYGSLTTYVAALQSLGMNVYATSSKYDIAEGNIPIAALPQLAEQAQTVDANPIFRPTSNTQGISPNQSSNTEDVPAAVTKYGVTGAGQKIGVLSNSISQVGTGLAGSVATGDLPADVQVLQDGQPGDDDEGRAMLEQIYDIAPGAKLAYATGDFGEVNFANNIEALYNVGATTIVDDLTYPDEPYFQDGIVAQGVNAVVAQGATYLSSAENISDSGYESQFRGVNSTITALGTGRYMNFDPTGATTTTELGINVYSPTDLFMQFDQPYYQTNGVTSNVEIDVLDTNGNLVTSGNSNTIATNTPFQSVSMTLPVGLFNVVIKVDSGPDPGHVFFYGQETAGQGGFSVDTKFGSAGGTYYPTTHGHNSSPNTISVGAVPFWGAQPYTNPTTASNEAFSSFGPVVQTFDANGNPITPTVYLKPDISGADGNNTSFFGGGSVDTSQANFGANPPYPGDPATTFSTPNTATNQSVPTLPNFFGTSSAAPNVAAVVALMKQSNPNLTRAEILQDLENTASPLDQSTKGTWTPQGGYGLVDALAAINAAQTLKVTYISPGANQTVTAAPTGITVSFNQPVLFSSISASDLKVNGPNGATVIVGTPISVGGSADPTQVTFPITIVPASGKIANGTYTDNFSGSSIISQNGAPLSAPVSDQFNLQVTNGPRVASTSFVGRFVNITFNEAVNPATITPSSVYLFRNNGVNNLNFNPNGIIVSQLPGAVTTYNASTFTVTINLTGVPQSSLPSDHYGLVVTNAVTDAIGVPLNGAFNGVFPSGTTPGAATGSIFFQDLGIVTVQAPIITYLGLTAGTDTGIQGDNNTNDSSPSIFGQLAATFPGTVSGVLVYAEFNGIVHSGLPSGGFNLGVGSGGRGYVGTFDVQTTTNALGQFIINYPAGVTPLPDGNNQIRVVAVGQPDQPPFPGLSSQQTYAFRIDTTKPYVGLVGGGQATSIPQNANISSFPSLTLNFIDPVSPQNLGSPFAVSPTTTVPALDPTAADNINNYKLFRVSGGTLIDESSYIKTAVFTSTSNRILSTDPYTGTVTLTFAPGLPTGSYKFLALSSAYGAGLSDAAGNAFGGYTSTPPAGASQNYELDFNLQPTPTYITNYSALTVDTGSSTGFDNTGPRANYEIPAAGVSQSVEAPPSEFTIDFSNSLDPTANYTNKVQLVRSANSPTSLPDGNFGDLGITNTSGYTVVAGVTVTLQNSVPGAVAGQYGYDNELLIKLPAGFTLPADYYRVYIPNSQTNPINDIFGNQLDGEFLGYQNAQGKYVDQLPTGTTRGSGANELPDLSGDGTPGGAFMTGFVVVPNGNVIYARADALYNPTIPGETPNGSQALPYPVLAPEATVTDLNGGNLNSPVNVGNFNTAYDYSGDGKFEPSAFYAAQLLDQQTGGPVVIIAEASIPSRDPSTGQILQKPFVLEAPAGSDASASVPAMTTLVFAPGTILKMQNAALLVQNQGSALQIDGGPNSYQTVTVTSYKDSSIGGVSNGNPNSAPSPGDYGGIVFRNYDQAAIPGSNAARTTQFPGQIPITGTSSDNLLKGPFTSTTDPNSQTDAVSGADDIMSYVSFLTEKYAGGVVPQNNGVQYDGLTLVNSRPTIVNSTISFAGTSGSAVAGLSVNVDSLRADDVAQGPLLRADQFINNGLNGIYIRAESLTGIAEATNAIVYPVNPTTAGGSANYVLDDPYPYLLTSRLVIGSSLVQESGGNQVGVDNRLYINPGMILKFELGSGILVKSGASINVGDSTYIKNFDLNNNYGPTLANGQPNPNFVNNSTTLSQVILTSLYDDVATTTYYDSLSQTTTTVTPALPAVGTGAGANQPTSTNVPAAARWGGIMTNSGSIDVINDADFRYAGGTVNIPTGSQQQYTLDINPGDDAGAFMMITDNTFTDNLKAPIALTPNALLAGDPTRPLLSGDPFIHNNVFQRNDLNGVLVEGGTGGANAANLTVNSVWTGSDFTYILENTIVEGGSAPAAGTVPTTTLAPEPKPSVLLTLQSTLPGTVLADGSTVQAPGVPLLIKLYNNGNPIPAETVGANPGAAIPNSFEGGAGFLSGVDNGVDPPNPDTLVDPGAFSQLRIVGIGANQLTGQARVPVTITSLFDDSTGTTVRGVTMNIADPGSARQTPQAGDGGVIYFGGNSLTSYDLQDPRYGPLIDNADINYITRIEQQGGGILYGFDTTGAGTAFTENYQVKLGLAFQITGSPIQNLGAQYNQAKSLTISNSNLNNFSDAAFVAHPGYDALVVAVNFPPGTNSQQGIFRALGYLGEATHTYFVNDTISNMSAGPAVQIVSENSDAINSPSPAMAVFLNDTFYNDSGGIHTYSPSFDGLNSFSHTSILVMDSIFSNITLNAIELDGQSYGSEVQYNLFNAIGGSTNQGTTNTAPNLVLVGNTTNTVTNDQPITGNPDFRNAGGGNFNLLPASAAIDVARSELGPSIFGDMLYPSVTVNNANLSATPIRNLPSLSTVAGDVNIAGGLGGAQYQNDIVTLPGEPVNQRGFPDAFTQVLQTAGTGTSSNYAPVGTYAYVPMTGQRDQNGNLRGKDPNSSNVGFGTNPFYDLGAFEYIIQNPPLVDSVVTTTSGSNTTTNIYGVGTIAGTNQLPSSIQVQFSQQINPATLNSNSVILEASGGTGLFDGNTSDRFINLAGLLSFNSTTDILTINTSGIFTSTATASDEYRLLLLGTGSSVIKNNDGLALDGLNLDSNGNQLALPSGADQFPGSNFQVTFTIDTHPPALVAGTFKLDPASDSSGGLNITNINLPTFDGTITDIFPPANPLLGDKVTIDVSTKGDGNFDLLGAGTGTTDANGNFKVTLTTPIPDTPNTVGTNGIQGSQGGIYTLIRVRVTDQSGNVSTILTAPYSTFLSNNSGTELQVDTKHPQIEAFSPLGGSLATPNASGGVTVSVTFNKNLKNSTLNANSVLVERTGGTGNFTTPVAVPIVAGSFAETYSTATATLGWETVTFQIAGPLPNDQYEIVLKGTGTNAITDLAGNALSGTFTGTFPTGSPTTSGDFSSVPFTVYQASQSHLIYVSAGFTGGTGTQGTRENPYPTITAAMTAAAIGDDVLVLPGTYREDVTVRPGIRLMSAATSSTDTTFTPGNANQTLIYGVPATGTTLAASNNNIVTVSISGNLGAIPTAVRGFSIISPLIGNTVTGTIDPTNVAIQAINSNAAINRNNIIDAGIGVNLATTGTNAATSNVFDNVIAGNIYGVVLSDDAATTSIAAPFQIDNNTIVDNTYGVVNFVSAGNSLEAFVVNNIIAYNHDLTTARNGTGVASNQPNTLGVGFNLFYQNGANNNASSNASGSFGLFNPSNLSKTQDALGNLLGNPYFIQPEDPRPNGDTPAVFFNYANFDITNLSLAVNAANQSQAPTSDFLYRTPVKVNGKGFANTGPASIGAYYPGGTSAIPVGTGLIFTGGGTGTGTGTGTGGTGTGGTGGSTGAITFSALGFGDTNTGSGSGSGSSSTSTSTPSGNGSTVTSSIGGGLALGTKAFTVVNTSLSSNGSAHAADGTSSGTIFEAAPAYIDINFSDSVNASSLNANDLVLTGSGLSSTNPAKATGLAWIDDHAVRFFITGGYSTSGTVNLSIPDGALTDTQGAGIVGWSDSIQLASSVLPSPAAPISTTVPAVTPTSVLSSVLPVVQPLAAASPVAVASKTAIAHNVKTSKAKAHHVTPVSTSHDKHSAAKATHKAAPAKPAKAATVAHKVTASAKAKKK